MRADRRVKLRVWRALILGAASVEVETSHVTSLLSLSREDACMPLYRAACGRCTQAVNVGDNCAESSCCCLYQV